jgi:hypothetical protein
MSEHEKPSVDYVEEASLERKKEESEIVVPVLTVEEEQRLWRKIDMRLMPMLSLMYLMSFLDRGVHVHIPRSLLHSNHAVLREHWWALYFLQLYTRHTQPFYTEIGNAKLQGLTDQLNLTGNKYNIALVCITSNTTSGRLNA